ncbi:MAG: 3-oxoacyl-[acyl-carrier-protein] synthase III C-terminal domain-containing protein [Gammaproteobacteria bacterium]
MPVFIQNQNYFVPSTCYDLETSAELFGLDVRTAKVYTKFYGLKNIPVASASGLALSDMLEKSIYPLVDLVPREKISYLIHTHTTPSIAKFFDSTVRRIGNKMGLKNAEAFAVTMNKCVSTIKAMEILDVILDDEEEKHALIIAGDMVFNNAGYRIMPNITVTADAAASVLVSNKSGHSRLIATSVNTYGKYARGVWMDLADVSQFGSTFNHCMAVVIDEVCSKAHITSKQIKIILPHNVNIQCWRSFASYYPYPLGNIYLKNIPRYAHCYNSDLLINLKSVLDEKLLLPGDCFVMAMVAVGASFGAALYQYLGDW